MILFFDTETTGFPDNWKAPITDFDNWPRIVQLAYEIYSEEGELYKSKNFIIKPHNFIIPIESSNIHGITTEYALLNGIDINEALNILSEDLNSCSTIVAHNLEFDYKVLGCEFLRNGMANSLDNKHEICTKLVSTDYCKISNNYGYKWPSLKELHFKLFDYDFEDAHDASVDISITAKCFWELVRIKEITLENSISISPEHKPEPESLLVPCFIEKNGEKKYGYMFSESKKIAIKCQFENTYPFNNNIAKVVYKGVELYVTSDGFFIQPDDNFLNNKNFELGLVAAKASRELNPLSSEKICGFVDIESDEFIKIPFDYTDVNEFINGFACVKKGGKWGVISTTGDIVIPFVFDWMKGFQNSNFIVKKNGKWGIIDINQNEILEIIYDGYYSSEKEMYHVLSKDGKSGFYNVETNDFYGLLYEGAYVFRDGIAAVKIDGKWGFIDKNWNTVLPFIYDGASSFSDGVAAVKNGNYWGYTNKDGEMVLPFIYKSAGNFSNGTSQVEFPLKFSQKLSIFLNGKYKRELHKINLKGESISSWTSFVENKQPQYI
jgi:DNA polymerase-3 subunit epsilon